MLPIGVEGHVPGSGAGGDRCERNRVWAEQTVREVEVQNVDLVGPQVHAKDVIAVQISDDLVGMRALLTGWD